MKESRNWLALLFLVPNLTFHFTWTSFRGAGQLRLTYPCFYPLFPFPCRKGIILCCGIC